MILVVQFRSKPMFSQPLRQISVLCLVSLLFVASCKKSDDDDDIIIGGGPITPSSTELNPTPLSSRCGAIVNEGFVSTVPAGQAELVDVTASSAELVVITRVSGIEAGNSQAVKLHGVSTSGVSAPLREQGKSLIQSLTAGKAYFVPAGSSCAVTINGNAQGVLGQLFTLGGVNINEQLLTAGAVKATGSEVCGSSLLASCYSSIEVKEETSSSVIQTFLWKPVAERDGNLVILVNPTGVTVTVSGNGHKDNGSNTGPSNGRGTTSRFGRPGCAYGSAVVEFFDSQGRRILAGNGDRSISVPSGCSRVERAY